MSGHRSLEDWLRIQESVHGTGIDLTLERVRAVAQSMGLLPPPFRTIIVGSPPDKGTDQTSYGIGPVV